MPIKYLTDKAKKWSDKSAPVDEPVEGQDVAFQTEGLSAAGGGAGKIDLTAVAFCQNCDAALAGPYCTTCGQKDDDLRRPFFSFFNDLLEGLFNLDSRIWKTLAVLLLMPGKLTKDFMEGKRARYMAPVRLYIGVSVVFFLLVWLLDVALLDIRLERKDLPPTPPEVSADQDAAAGAQASGQLNQDEDINIIAATTEPTIPTVPGAREPASPNVGKIIQKVIEEIEEDDSLSAAELANKDLKDIEQAVKQAEEELKEVVNEEGDDVGVEVNADGFPYSFSVTAFSKLKEDDERIGLTEEDLNKLKFSDSESEKMFKPFFLGLSDGFKDPAKFNALFNDWLPRVLFVLVPVFAMILRLFHWGQKRYYVHQLVFSLHFHSFLFLMMSSFAVLMPLYGSHFAAPIFWIGSSIYLIIALKVGENQSWIRAFLKAGFIWVSYAVLLTGGLAYGVFEGLRQL